MSLWLPIQNLVCADAHVASQVPSCLSFKMFRGSMATELSTVQQLDVSGETLAKQLSNCVLRVCLSCNRSCSIRVWMYLM